MAELKVTVPIKFSEKAQKDLYETCMAYKELAEMRGAENDKLRELCKKFAEYVSYDRCEGCVVKTACRNAEIDECWMFTNIRELASELELEVDG